MQQYHHCLSLHPFVCPLNAMCCHPFANLSSVTGMYKLRNMQTAMRITTKTITPFSILDTFPEHHLSFKIVMHAEPIPKATTIMGFIFKINHCVAVRLQETLLRTSLAHLSVSYGLGHPLFCFCTCNIGSMALQTCLIVL